MTSIASERIDTALLQTASGADAAELAQARLSGAQAKTAATAKAQADAERAVIEAQAQAAAAEDGDTAATERLTAASDALAAAQKRAALATKEEAAAADHAAAVGRAQAAAAGETTVAADRAAASHTRLGTATTGAAASSGLLAKGMKAAGLGVAAIGFLSVKAAGNFESMTQHLVTDAGESQKNIGMIRSGMLALATTTGTTTQQMSAGMYHIESAGFHGKAGLDVLRAAAEGAKVGGADLDVVGKTLTGTMNSYASSGYSATQMMNMLITTVGAGDMKMNDLASSLGNVAPAAAAAGISFGQVGGAIATMTAQNMSAAQATQDLNHTIQSLENPTLVQIKEMQAMGLSSNDLSKNLGKRGLSGTLDMLVSAIAAHTKGGMVLQSTLKSSEVAAANAKQAIGALPPSIQGVAKSLLGGSLTAAQYGKAIKDLPVAQHALALQFEGLVKKTGSFNDLLKSGSPAAQTMNAALAKMTGGTTGLTTALMLTGGRAKTFADNAKNIAEAGTKAGTTVDNWGKIQGTFNQKMDRVKASVEAAGISIGTALLPAVSSIAGAVANVLGPMASWIAHNQTLLGFVVSIVGPAAAMVGVIKTVVAVTKAWKEVQLALNLAMDANPLGLWMVALAAVVGGLIYAYTHFKGFRDVVQGVFHAVAGAAVGLWHAMETAWHAISQAAVAVGHALQTAWNAVVTAAMTVWHALQTAWNAVMSVTTAVWNAITGFFAKWWPLLLVIFLPPIALLLAIWNHFHDQITAVATAAWNGISAFFQTVWTGIKTMASTVWRGVQVAIVNPILDVWHFLQSTWKTVSAWLSTAWNDIRGVASAIWSRVASALTGPLSAAWHTITGTVGRIKDAISSGLDGAWNAVKGIGDKFLQIGKAIVDGIIHGVENSGSALFDSLKGLAKGALDAAKSFLGINSPSKVFADHVGMAIPEGIAKGVSDHAHLAHTAVTRLSAGLVGTGGAQAPQFGGGVLSGIGGLAYAGGGGGGVTQNINVSLGGAYILNERNAAPLAQVLGKAIAASLPGAGVRIRS
jgi:TP901 family phage tail tape measure protein